MDYSGLLEELSDRLPGLEMRRNEPLAGHTSLKIGGPAAVMAFPRSAEELRELVLALEALGVAPLIVGNGTNLLAPDGPLDRFVVKTAGLTAMRLGDATAITAQSGAPLSRLAAFACENGLTGLEFAHGIPGTLGGAVCMNAGAYGGEMKDIVVKTEFLGPEGPRELYGGEHLFGYRRSFFSDHEGIVLRVTLNLKPGDPEAIARRMEELSLKRRTSQPLDLPSCGSAFKRPAGGYAAAMIEECGLKGFAIGGAQVSEKHAGFIVNRGGATYAETLRLIEYIQDRVSGRFGVLLEPEIKILK